MLTRDFSNISLGQADNFRLWDEPFSDTCGCVLAATTGILIHRYDSTSVETETIQRVNAEVSYCKGSAYIPVHFLFHAY